MERESRKARGRPGRIPDLFWLEAGKSLVAGMYLIGLKPVREFVFFLKMVSAGLAWRDQGLQICRISEDWQHYGRRDAVDRYLRYLGVGLH